MDGPLERRLKVHEVEVLKRRTSGGMTPSRVYDPTGTLIRCRVVAVQANNQTALGQVDLSRQLYKLRFPELPTFDGSPLNLQNHRFKVTDGPAEWLGMILRLMGNVLTGQGHWYAWCQLYGEDQPGAAPAVLPVAAAKPAKKPAKKASKPKPAKGKGGRK